jgi:hypothetical protein
VHGRTLSLGVEEAAPTTIANGDLFTCRHDVTRIEALGMGVDCSANCATTRAETEMFFTVVNRALAIKFALLIFLNSNNLGKFELTNIP